MPYPAWDASMDSIAQWIDASLISDPTLLHLTESFGSTPFNSSPYESSGSLMQEPFAVPMEGETNSSEPANGFEDGYAHPHIAKKPLLVKSDTTSGSFSVLEELSGVRKMPDLDEVMKVKKEVSDHS